MNAKKAREIIESFCEGKYEVDAYLYPYCISVEREISKGDTSTFLHFTIFLEDNRYHISSSGSCGMDNEPIENGVALYAECLDFLKDMRKLKNELVSELAPRSERK